MQQGLNRLSLAQVNAAIKKHLTSQDLKIVMITAQARELQEQLLSQQASQVTYDGEKSPALLEEDRVIGSYPLKLKSEAIQIIPVEQVFTGASAPGKNASH